MFIMNANLLFDKIIFDYTKKIACAVILSKCYS